MGKWDDDIPLQPVGTVEPTSVPALLRMLGLVDATEAEQKAAIADWLRKHEAGPLMEYGLKRCGFADLLSGSAEVRR